MMEGFYGVHLEELFFFSILLYFSNLLVVLLALEACTFGSLLSRNGFVFGWFLLDSFYTPFFFVIGRVFDLLLMVCSHGTSIYKYILFGLSSSPDSSLFLESFSNLNTRRDWKTKAPRLQKKNTKTQRQEQNRNETLDPLQFKL